jgi:tetratricopeptide (TPR) repeat protein
MTPEDWQRVKPILAAALELDSANRASFLKEACADASLRDEIQSLIVAHEQAGAGALNSEALPSLSKSALVTRLELTNGTRLGDFQIFSLIGAGGMGEVYRARDLRLERDVAIKVLPRFVSLDPDRLRRFEQEAKAAAALNHPNILAVFQMGTYEGAPYLVSELLEGDTLRGQVKRGPIAPKKAAECGVQIAHGLAAAHEKGIVHRDLKPENLFVTREGRVKILDFGLAKLMHSDSETQFTQRTLDTEPGAVMGTVGYMSPEQVRGLATDHRSDIFAFGAILYEMLTGRRAFHKPTSAETMSAILNEDPPPISQVTSNVPPALERAVHRCLEKSPEQRFQSAPDLAFALEITSDSSSATKQAIASALLRGAWTWMAAAGVALAALFGILLWHPWAARALTEKDTIVLADFNNTTGDAVFDGTLKQGLAVQLDQSPFLNVLSGQKVQDTLKLMGRSPGERLTPELARDLCQRVASKAYLDGAIAGLGSQYVIAINLVNCQTGDFLAREQVTASGKEQVLKALDEAARKLRGKAGESLGSVQKFDVPIEQASTPSLEALKAYSLGMKVRSEQGYVEAIPFFKRSIELDPNFASAYASLGSCYGNSGEIEVGREYIRKAFELSDRTSEREKLRISNIYRYDTGELEKALEVAKLWAQEYPRDELSHVDSGFTYGTLGQAASAITAYLEALRLDPDDGGAYGGLMFAYADLNRFDEAKTLYKQAQTRGINGGLLHLSRYMIAFSEGDQVEISRQMAWAANRSGVEDSFLGGASRTEQYYGHLRKGRELLERAIASALRNNRKEAASYYEVNAAWAEADYGNYSRAREGAKAALARAASRDVQITAALSLARAGDSEEAERLANDLAKRFPLHTLVQGYWLPTIRAAIEIKHNNPTTAIELLKATSPLEMMEDGSLYAVYLRGVAYLLLHQGNEAAAEFQKISDHRGLLRNSSWGALAALGLARAYALQGDTTKAKAAYQHLLTLWKDADPDIPILKEAKAEHAKLQ